MRWNECFPMTVLHSCTPLLMLLEPLSKVETIMLEERIEMGASTAWQATSNHQHSTTNLYLNTRTYGAPLAAVMGKHFGFATHQTFLKMILSLKINMRIKDMEVKYVWQLCFNMRASLPKWTQLLIRSAQLTFVLSRARVLSKSM